VIGQAGLERTFESELRGAPGEEQMEVDATGREVRSLQVNNPNPGHNLVLTIDAGLQNLAAEAISAGIDQYRTASVVALDPRNGQVLALVSLPSYDDNLFAEGISDADYGRLIQDPRHPLLNNAVAGAYPPGTAFDAITALAGLDANVITPKTQIDCQGFITVPNRFDPTVGSKLFDWKALGPQDPESALADACKVFWYEVGGGEPNGKWPGAEVDGLTRYAHLFGLGEPTGIDLVEEAGGLVPSVRWKRQNYNQEWVPMDTYQLAVGEGYVSVSPLQMASVAATLANGGTVYRPQVALEALDNQGNVTATYASDVVRQLPAKPENVALVRQGMVDAASSGKTANGLAFDGTARLAAVPGWAVAGLTASVEFGTPDANGVLPTHGWFIGFAPADHPVIALAVFVERGTGPADAAKVAQQVFAYYQKETTGH
jgi:penicillin-binding protein 2